MNKSRRLPHHGRGGQRHVGRLRIRAAEILSREFGFEVSPDDIQPASGAWRTNIMLDVYRWELYTGTAGNRVIAGCWDTLTYFVREASKHGCHVHDGVIHVGRKQ